MPRSPNCLVFLTDQQRWDTTGVHGNPLDLTPNFDRLAARGTHLAHMITCQPVCGPARSCLQTGRYATSTGCFRNGIALRSDARTLAHCFAEAGYATGYIGKWHLADDDPVRPEQRGGYDYWLAANTLEHTSHPYRMVLYDGQGQAVHLPGYRVDAQTDAVIRYLDAHRDIPFFLFVSYLEPHHQNDVDDYPPPDGYRERYAGRWVPPDLAALGGSAHRHLGGYFGMVKRLDEALGRILDALKSLDLIAHTNVAFTSDHGCHFKTRNGEYKRSWHESSVRVPAALQGPAFDGGGRVDHPVSLVDLPPTLLDACGLPVPDAMQGRSVLPLLRPGTPAWPGEAYIQVSEDIVGRAVRTRRWKYGVAAPDRDPWRDAGAERYVETELFDLEYDPHELSNLIHSEAHAAVAARLAERLKRRAAEAGEGGFEIVPAERKKIGQREVRPGEEDL